LKKLPNALDDFGGKVLDKIEDLIGLSGVGRKTANVVAAVAFGKLVIGVDTHVHKVMNRAGFAKTKVPEETEKILNEFVSDKYKREFNFLVVAFGQNVCTLISPKCSECAFKDECPKINVRKKR